MHLCLTESTVLLANVETSVSSGTNFTSQETARSTVFDEDNLGAMKAATVEQQSLLSNLDHDVNNTNGITGEWIIYVWTRSQFTDYIFYLSIADMHFVFQNLLFSWQMFKHRCAQLSMEQRRQMFLLELKHLEQSSNM